MDRRKRLSHTPVVICGFPSLRSSNRYASFFCDPCGFSLPRGGAICLRGIRSIEDRRGRHAEGDVRIRRVEKGAAGGGSQVQAPAGRDRQAADRSPIHPATTQQRQAEPAGGRRSAGRRVSASSGSCNGSPTICSRNSSATGRKFSAKPRKNAGRDQEGRRRKGARSGGGRWRSRCIFKPALEIYRRRRSPRTTKPIRRSKVQP